MSGYAQIRERPYQSMVEQVKRDEELITPEDKERRAKTALATFGVATATAVGATVVGVVRRLRS